MVLFTAAGYAAYQWLGVEQGLLFGLLAGFVVANLIPARGGCAVKRPPSPTESEEAPHSDTPASRDRETISHDV